MYTRFLSILVFCWLCALQVKAQINILGDVPIGPEGDYSYSVAISGPFSACANEETTYCLSSSGYCGTISWTASAGEIVNGQGTETVTIRFNTPGQNVVSVQVWDCFNVVLGGYVSMGSSASLDVSVSGPAPIPAPVVDNRCGSSLITVAGVANGSLYWQTSPTGTNTDLPASTYTESTSRTRYLRARYNNSCWSPAQTVAIAPVQVPATPLALTGPSAACGPITINRGTPPSGETWYWQASATGTDVSNSSSSYVFSATGTVFLRARNNTTGCWSSAVSHTVTITLPTAPNAVSIVNQIGSSSVTVPIIPGAALYWQTSETGTSTAEPASNYTETAIRTRYLRAYYTATGCWSVAKIVFISPSSMTMQTMLDATGLPAFLPSANALSVVEAPQHQRGLATGTPEIAIPLHNLQSRSLSLPIRLDYDARGVRVGEVASWVGLNWRLEAGGAIARVVHGQLDRFSKSAGQVEVSNAEEQDVFYFSIGGVVGKFAFYPNNGNSGAGVFRTIPYSQWRVDPSFDDQGDVISFRLISESGTEFIFGGGNAYDFSEIFAVNQAGFATTIMLRANSAWYIREINAADRSDQISFTYTTEIPSIHYTVAGVGKRVVPGTNPTLTTSAVGGYIQSQSGVTGSLNIAQCGYAGEQVSEFYYLYHKGLHFARLSAIHYIGGKVEFIAGNNRCDLPGTALLWKVNVYDQNRLVKSFDTYHDYFNENGSCASPIDDHRRLRLMTLYQRSVLPDNLPPLVTRFTYDTRRNLPARWETLVDSWGYFNNNNNGTRIAAGGSGGADRSSTTDPIIASTWMLTTIRSPLGAITRYDWEPHVSTTGPVGGVRLLRTTIMPDGIENAPENTVRKYEYLTTGVIGQNNSRVSSGRAHARPAWKQDVYAVVDGPVGATNLCCPYQIWWGSTYPVGFGLLGESIVYEGVWEYLGENGELGVSHYEYIPGANDASFGPTGVNYAGSLWTSRAWRHGYLSREQHFDMEAGFNGRKLVAETVYQRTVYDHQPPSHQYRSQQNLIVRNLKFQGFSVAASNAYHLESGWSHPTRTIATTFTQDATPVPVTSLTQYSYNPQTMLVTSVESMPVRSRDDLTPIGRIEGTATRYVEDIDLTNKPEVYASEAHPIRAMQGLQWRGVPIEVLSYYKNSAMDGRKIIGGSLSIFLNHFHNNSWWAPKPKLTRTLKLGQPLLWSTFTHADMGADGQLIQDSRYYPNDPRGEIAARNYLGQTITSKAANGLLSSVQYDAITSTYAEASVSNGILSYFTNFLHQPNPFTRRISASYCGFETGPQDMYYWTRGWVTSGQVTTASVFAGKYAAVAPATASARDYYDVAALHFQPDDLDGVYLFSAWVKSDSPGRIRLATCTADNSHTINPTNFAGFHDVAFPATGNQWKLVQVKMDLGLLRRNHGAHFLPGDIWIRAAIFTDKDRIPVGANAFPLYADELRIQKIDAQMTHRVVGPFGPTAVFNEWNYPTFQEYDGFGRPTTTRDWEGNILKHIQYNVKPQ